MEVCDSGHRNFRENTELFVGTNEIVRTITLYFITRGIILTLKETYPEVIHSKL